MAANRLETKRTFGADCPIGTNMILTRPWGWSTRAGWPRVGMTPWCAWGCDANPEFMAFWVKDGRVLAGMNFNVWDVHDDIRALITAGYSGKAVNLEKLSDPQVPLSELS